MTHFIIAGKVLLIVFISFLITLAAVKAVKLIGIDMKDFKQRTGFKFLGIGAFFNLLLIVTVFLIFHFLDGKNISGLGFDLSLNQAVFSLIALVLTLIISLATILILHNTHALNFQFRKIDWSDTTQNLTTLAGYGVLMIAALQEEILFRGYLSSLLIRYGFFFSLLLSTIIFTAWHFLTNKTNLYQVMDWFIGGALLYYLYIESGSIWLATFVHFSRNFANVLIFDIGGSSSVIKLESHITPPHKTLYTLLLSLMIYLCWLFIH